MSHSRKRKHSPPPTTGPSSDPNLFVQAQEADIVHGPQGELAAQSLEVRGANNIGNALIRLFGDEQQSSKFIRDDEESLYGFATDSRTRTDEIWVDRYDARLLLDREEFDALRQVQQDTTSTSIRASSPDGWSDLPSDTEDTFFFTPEETDDYRRDKRRRLLEETRERRLKARMLEDGDTPGDNQEEPWGGSDEEPDEAQKQIMHRTAKHIATSPNPSQLEMRILANHGNDKRFAFLRGRWSRAWQIEKGRARIENEKGKKPALLGTLADYGDSSGDEDDSIRGASAEPAVDALAGSDHEIPPPAEQVQSEPGGGDDSVAMEARRARAKEWIAKRRAA
ncbi:hypothetical protein AAF712_007322 [Marasmius tenuissimus]|uniref:Uncharacterized protein n=1 Tax=Marasmius tenuissimus TaxID=585030 RepID=A0ABR2ZVR3_9AGAR